jgi:regulator of replication initiation timing
LENQNSHDGIQVPYRLFSQAQMGEEEEKKKSLSLRVTENKKRCNLKRIWESGFNVSTLKYALEALFSLELISYYIA